MTDYAFPLSLSDVPKAARGDYPSDSGCDIITPYVTLVAVGDGEIVYSEWGHVKPRWRKAPNTAFAVKIKLDKPVVRNGIAYPYVFYAHMSNLTPRAKGSRVEKGASLGTSGQAGYPTPIPHLHITFYRYINGGEYLGMPPNSKDDENMMWDEWLPAQRAVIENEANDHLKEERVVTYAYQSGRREYSHEVVGLISDHDKGKEVWSNYRGHDSELPTTVQVTLYPEKGNAVPIKVELKDQHPESLKLSDHIKGVFGAKFTAPMKFSMSVKQYE